MSTVIKQKAKKERMKTTSREMKRENVEESSLRVPASRGAAFVQARIA
jgi:hypothetical protein